MTKTGQVRDRYDETASHYNARYAGIQQGKYGHLVHDIRDAVQDPGNGVIVDLGCGSGLLGRYLEDRFPALHAPVVGVDVSRNMLREARRAVPPGHLALVEGTVDALPLRPGTAWWVVSISTCQNLDEPQRDRFLDEMRRVGRCGCLISLSFLNKPPMNQATLAILERLRTLFGDARLLPVPRDVEDACISCRPGP